MPRTEASGVGELRRRLGEQLRALRQTAGLNQDQLARRIGYGRSTVTGAESGQQQTAAEFWARCDHELAAAGVLVLGYRGLTGARERPAQERSQRAEAEREARIRQWRDQMRISDDLDSRGPEKATGEVAALGVDLWELHEALRGGRVGGAGLALAEASCARLDALYAEVSPQAVLPEVGIQLRKVTKLLGESQPVEHRRRLCSVAGRLAGLRAWLLFDLADHRAADLWYEAAIQCALEAEDGSLHGWLLGARSLIPAYRHDHHAALSFIERGQAETGRRADATVRAWLGALEARARAGLRDVAGFRAAQERASGLVDRTAPAERRHGMDFSGGRLDLTYYEGTSRLLLRQPAPAAEYLRAGLKGLPATHHKARAILLLDLAGAAAQRRSLDDAGALGCEALALASSQPINPILRRARDLRRELGPDQNRVAPALDERLAEFAARLGCREPDPA
jgi:transcriptional regulator with XRE-family HTH domain